MRKIIIYILVLLCPITSLFAQPGTLDPSFGTGGKVVVPQISGYSFYESRAMAIQADGKVVMTYYAYNNTTSKYVWSVVRLNTNGTLDNSFSGDGRAFAEFPISQNVYPYDIAIAPDGKIVVTGQEYQIISGNYYYSMSAVRFNTDGSLDNSFDGDGFVYIDQNINSNDLSFGVDVQQDGKILLTGRGVNPQTGQYDFKVVRLTTNGVLDNSFDVDGRAYIDFSNNYEESWKVKVQDDGKIIVVGHAYNYINSNNYYDFAIARLNTDGSLDNGFGTGGKALVDVGGYYDYAWGLDFQLNGKIVVAGYIYNNNSANYYDYGVCRLNANGTLDNNFDGDGKKTINLSSTSTDVCWSVAVQADGRILLNGYGYNGTNYDFGIVRLNEDGSFDNSFDGDGILNLDFANNSHDLGFDLGLQQDGKIVVTGYSNGSFGYGPAAARLLNDVLTYTLSCPSNQTVNANAGQCSAIVDNIDPVLNPPGSFSLVNYSLSGATTGSGSGSVSGMSFNYGTTTVTYTLASDATKTCSFTITVNAGTDTDNDGIPNACDPDDDNDGIPDGSDCAPLNPSQLVASSSVTYGTPGPPNSVVFNSPTDYTFSSGGTGVGNTGGRTWFFNNINDASYSGLWWTFNPIANPRHSSQAANGNMSFSNYNPVTGIATFTSTANMIWSANSGVENIQTRLRIQFQPYSGIHSNTPLGSGWVDPVTAGIINLNSLASGHPLIDIKAIAGIKKFQVWFILEEVNTGTPLNVYFATFPHTSTVGGTIVTSVSGNFFGSTVLNSPATSTTLNSPADYTFSSGGTGVGNTGGRTWFFNNINDAPYTGLWWTFNPLANPRHSSQGATGNMAFTSYNPATGIATFTSTANMVWSANSGVESIQTRLRIQFQPHTGIHSNTPLGSGWVDPITAGIINLNSLASGHTLIDIKAIAGIKKFQVWFILEEVNTGTPLNVYYATYPHTSTGGGTVVTSVSGNFFSTSASVCNGGTGAVTITATGGTAPYSGAGTFVLPPGSYNYVVTDAAGCTTNVPFTVVAQVDVTDPVITCPGNISADAPLNSCSASVPFVATATDNCSATIKYYLNYNTTGVLEISSGHVFAVGVYTVSAVATDPAGNDDDCSFTITVNDVTKPTFVCPSDQNVNLNGACQLVVPDLITGLTGSDNCGTVTFTQSPLAGASLASSHNQTHNVVITASDGNGNTQTCTVVLTGKDVTKPTFNCPDNQNINLNATCQLVVPNLVSGLTGSDNCGTVTFTQSPLAGASLASSHNQTHNVVITASDGNGNTQSCTVVLTGKDVTQPTFNCPSNQNVNLNGSCQLIVPNLIAALTGNDNCGTVTFTQSPLAGESLASSHNQTHSVLITASDGNGNTETCTVVLTGKDVTQPTFNCPSNQNVNLNGSCQLIVPNLISGLTGSDNCGTVTFTQSPLAGASFSSSNNQTYDVVITASDGNGNTQTCTVILTGKDVTKPTVTAPTSVDLECSGNLPAPATTITQFLALAGSDANDNCTVQAALLVSSSDGPLVNGNCNGTITRTYTITDAAGNATTVDHVFTVTDNTKPTATAPTTVDLECSSNLPAGKTTIAGFLYLAGANANDNCTPQANLQVSFVDGPLVSGNCNGTITRTYTITDACGNTTTVDHVFTVTDNTKPTATAPATVDLECSSNLPAGKTTIAGFLYLTGANANDNCTPQANLQVSFVDGPLVSSNCNGSITRTYTITDACGNTTTVNHVFTVTDNTKPTATAPATVDLECSSDLPAGKTTIAGFLSLAQANANDNCTPQASLLVSFVDGPLVSSNCNGTITRTYTITDACNNTTTVNHVFTVTDNTIPVINTCPGNGVTFIRNTNAGVCTYQVAGTEFNATGLDNCTGVTMSYSIVNEHNPGTVTGTGSLAGKYLSFGLNTITWIATDGCGNTSVACSVKVDVDKITTTTTLTVNPTSQQYSDLVTFTATVTPNNCTGAGNIGGTVTFKIGSLIIGTAPVINGIATITAPLIEDMLYDANLNDPMNPTNGPLKPGAKTVTAYFSGTDADYIVTNPTAPLTVTCENADITYNGQTYFSVSPNTNAGTVVLSNYVVDKNDTPTGARGDIRNATATFWQNAINGSVLGTANVPVGLVNPANKQEGFVTTSFNDVLSNTDISNGGKVYEVWSGLNNYYCENSDTYTPVTLGLPGQDFVTGGGYIVFGNNSAGTYAGTQGKRMNFGFVMKWNSSGKNLQGRVNVVYRKMVNGVQRIYQIKSNAINSLVVENVNDAGSPATGTNIKFRRATISTKANLADITDPLNPISLGGNLSLTLIGWESTTVTTGALDRINFQLSGSGSIGLLFSSNWVSGNTSWQTLSGGKIQVRNPSTPAPGQRTTTSEEIITKTSKLHLLIKAFPNPSENYFNLTVEGNRSEDVVVSVYNVSGVRIHQVKGNANRIYKFGEGWIPGTYLVEVRQGNELKTVKLVKQ